MQLPILCAPAAFTFRLVDLGQRRDDILGPAKLGQRKLDARARRLLGLEEDELMRVQGSFGKLLRHLKSYLTFPAHIGRQFHATPTPPLA
jgi:hypothetical protein